MKQEKQTFFLIKSWSAIAAISLLCYLPFLINFIWGNHDWWWIKDHTPLLSGLFEGRFSQFILPTLLFSGNILPIFSTTAGLLLYALSAVLLLKLWQAPENKLFYILLALSIVTAPYTISWFYFAFLSLSCLSWPLVIILAYLLLEHPLKYALNLLLAVVLFVLALGGYPPIINMIGVIFFTLILKDLCLKGLSVKSLMQKYLPHILSLLFAALISLFILHLLKKYNLQQNTYNTAAIDLKTLPNKLNFCLKAALQQFTITKSFISYFYKYIMLCFVLIAFIELFICLPKKFSNILCFILSFTGLLLSSVITLLVAQNIKYVIYEPRIEFFSLPYIYAFSAFVLLHKGNCFLKNLTTVLLALLILYNINTAALASKVWTFGFKAENAYAERFITRLEQHDAFKPQTKKYTFVQGGTLNFRKNYYIPQKDEQVDAYTINAPYIPPHLPYKAYTFYYPYIFVDKDFDIFWSFVPPSEIDLNLDTIQYITTSAQPWPNQNATYITPELIILTLTNDGLWRAQHWLQNNFNIN